MISIMEATHDSQPFAFQKRHWISIFIGLLLLLALATFPPSQRLRAQFVSHTAYFGMGILFFFFIWSTAQWILTKNLFARTELRHRFPGLVTALLLAAGTFAIITPDLRVLNDEANLLNTSRAMSQERLAVSTRMGQWYHGNYYPLDQALDKRPFFFPFLTSLLHSLTGYRAENVYVLNFILLVGFLFLVYAVVERWGGPALGIIAQILLVSQPLLLLTATSGGYDLAALLSNVVVLVALYSYLERKSSVRLSFLLSSLLVSTQIRYEGLFFAGVLLLVLTLYKKISIREWYSQGPLIGLGAYLGTLRIFHHDVTRLQIADNDPNLTVLALARIPNNLQEFFRSFIDFSFFLPFTPALYFVSVFAVVVVALMYWRTWRGISEPVRWTLLSGVTFIAIHFFLVLCHFRGQPSHPTSARFFLPEVCFLALLPLVLAFTKRIRPSVLLLIAIGNAILYFSVSTDNRFFNGAFLSRAARFETEFFAKEPDKRFLVVAAYPGILTAHDYGAVDYEFARKQPEWVLSTLRDRLIDRLYLVQRKSMPGRISILEDVWNGPFAAEAVAERKIDQDSLVTIYRVRLATPK